MLDTPLQHGKHEQFVFPTLEPRMLHRINRRYLACSLVAVTLFVPACSDDTKTSSGTAMPPPGPPPAAEDKSRDIVHTDLAVDLAAMTSTATITLAPSTSEAASFEAAGLTIADVRNDEGKLNWAMVDGRLDVGVPKSDTPAKVIVDYAFDYHENFDGLSKSGFTLVWPYWCGNLFPCKSDPADGLTFGLSVKGQPAGETSIYPESVAADSASYQIAWSTGEYTKLDLGTTTAGTQIVAYHLPDGAADAQTGTMYLRDTFDWFEKTYGSYIFGKIAGSVSAKWSPVAYGGMEHHPLWHIGYVAMKDPWIHAHEAAHGWFGDGVRIACWEDFVLSEGTVSYLEARVITQLMGDTEGQKLWDHYQTRLNNAMSKAGSHIAWPDSCGVVDVLKDGLFGDIPYMKGAFFYKALEAKITATKLDEALASFYGKYKGKSAKMQDLLDEIKATSGYDPNACAQAWLRSDAVPMEMACP
jgi:hypothetical protein